MTWIKSKVEEMTHDGFEIPVGDLNIKNAEGKPIDVLKFGILTENESYVISQNPEILSRPDGQGRVNLTITMTVFERLKKKDKSLTWEDFKQLDSSFINTLSSRMSEVLGAGIKNS